MADLGRPLSIRLPPSLMESLSAEAAESGRTLSNLVRFILLEHAKERPRQRSSKRPKPPER